MRVRGKWLRKWMFGIALEEATFERRGFWKGRRPAQRRLETVGRTFLRGYHLALEHSDVSRLGRALREIEHERRGFAFEGAAMGWALLDQITPWNRNRLRSLWKGPGAPHVYMVHVGAGWAVARLRRSVESYLEQLDPLLRWLVVDGYGFHEGYFHWPQSVREQVVPEQINGYAQCAFDQGLGRSLWFVEGADVGRIASAISAFAPARQSYLWSGVGLAAAYAGGVTSSELVALWQTAGAFRSDVAQGGAFAAEARQRAGNPAGHTNVACAVLCGCSAEEAATITNRARQNLPADGPDPAYEVWRRRVKTHFSRHVINQPIAPVQK